MTPEEEFQKWLAEDEGVQRGMILNDSWIDGARCCFMAHYKKFCRHEVKDILMDIKPRLSFKRK
jgi:hypothetical protein